MLVNQLIGTKTRVLSYYRQISFKSYMTISIKIMIDCFQSNGIGEKWYLNRMGLVKKMLSKSVKNDRP